MNPQVPAALVSNIIGRAWAVFAEPGVRINSVELQGTSYWGFGSYMNSGMVRSYSEVGRYASIGRQVSIGLGHHDMSLFSTSPFFAKHSAGSRMPMASENPKRRVLVGHDCWIGDGVMIVSGVTIGTGAICAAGAVVTKDVRPYEIVGGVPAKHIGWRFEEDVRQRMLASRWWDHPFEVVESCADPDTEAFLDRIEATATGGPPSSVQYSRILPSDAAAPPTR
ncbi:CatB-related O-acetyltransferase [Kocuria sp. M1R5S2]|uniref:CatB-related O-acetyltransferase n=1 Tax=Kocuria rhizosphaerae TaxID=3376285 RepID=UPI0037973F34